MTRWKRTMLILAALALLAGMAMECAFSEQTPAAEESTPENSGEITLEDAALSIQCNLNKHVLPAGGRMQFKATFAAPDKISAQAGNDHVAWSVQMDNGKKVDASLVKINGKGLLTTTAKVRKGTRIKVICQSKTFGTRAEYDVLVYPPIRRASIRPSNPLVFLGGENPLVLSATTVPSRLGQALTWKVRNKKIAQLKRNPDGSVSVTPLKAGATTLTAYAGNRVIARTTLTVMPEITGIEIVGEDYVRKGGYLNLTARALPRSAQVRRFSWALDVDKSIAAISTRGRLTPTAKCPVGTVITVTCWPKGADKTMAVTKEIVVTYPVQRLN